MAEGRATQEQLPRRREGATWVKQAFAKRALRAAELPTAVLLGRPVGYSCVFRSLHPINQLSQYPLSFNFDSTFFRVNAERKHNDFSVDSDFICVQRFARLSA